MIQIFSDFDGTVTNRDSIVFLTEHFGGGRHFRESVLRKFETGEADSFETIEMELASVRVSWEEAAQALKEHIVVDPEFPGFVDWCGRNDHPLSVVSSGIQQVVSLFIGDLDVPFYAHPTTITEEEWQYSKDESADKTHVLRRAKSEGRIVYIGDGISDVCAVPYADVLFAKNRLATHCQKQSIPFFPFQSFREVQSQLERVLGSWNMS